MTTALFTDRKRLGYLIGFYRDRRELGFSLLYGNDEAAGQRDQVQENVRRYAAVLGAIGLIIVAAGIFSNMGIPALASESSCFACLFDSLQNWWDGLNGWEQAAIILGAFALSILFVSFWPALGIAMTGAGIAGGGHEIAGYIRDPKKLLSPQNAAVAVLAVVLSRIPFGKGLSWLSRKLGPRARKRLDNLAEKVGSKPRQEPDAPSGGSRDHPLTTSARLRRNRNQTNPMMKNRTKLATLHKMCRDIPVGCRRLTSRMQPQMRLPSDLAANPE